MGAATKPTAAAEAIATTETSLVEAQVARGRSVLDDTGKLRRAGETVILPADEAIELLKLGYLVDPNEPAPPEANGPTFDRR